MKKIITLLTTLILAVSLSAQSSVHFWKDQAAVAPMATKAYLPNNARILSLDYKAIRSFLQSAPLENTEANPLQLELPLPQGGFATFGITEISIMEPGLAKAFPMIKTYAGNGVDDPSMHIRIETGSLGFHATIFKGLKTDIIESVAVDNTEMYASYHLEEADHQPVVNCGNHDESIEPAVDDYAWEDDAFDFGANKSASVAVDLRTYRLAIATTNEFSAQNGNNVASVLAAVTSIVNQVNAILEKEVAVRLMLIDDTDKTFYFAADGNDPYDNGDAAAMIGVNQTIMTNFHGADAYDIGHVFGTASGGGVVGLAQLASICNDDSKGRGVSNVLGGGFYQTVVHEVGHQLNATHTFDYCDSQGNETPATAYEPGGGSTIMAYSGACFEMATGINNIVQNNADDYFHINSLEKMIAFKANFATGASCGVLTPTGNNTPEVSIPIEGGFRIPISTPFELTGEAVDPDGDAMTYNWEQYDLKQGQSILGSPAPGDPHFRSVLPSSSLTRIFPKIQTIVNNTTDKTEVLPTASQPFTFRFTARDNKMNGGGYGYDEIKFDVTSTAGPFLVTEPNANGITWEVGDYVEVTWDVANTDGPQVDCQLVDIYLSLDGGFTYPVTLLTGTPNDGSAFVVVPDEVTSFARVKVKGSDNIFFDISNNNFTIVETTTPDFIISSYGPEYGVVCVPSTFEVTLETAPILGFSENITFSVTDLPAGATASFSANTVAPGGSTTLTIDFADVTDDGHFSVKVIAEAAGVDAEERLIELNVVTSDFSAMTLNAPVGSKIGILPTYEWSALSNGLFYNIEVATDPAFANIIDGATDLAETTYTSGVTLEDNTIYYWRVQVTNECGTGETGQIGAFRTVAQACTENMSTGSVNLPQSTGTTEIPINFPLGGEIADVNIKNIVGVYDAFVNLNFNLISPAGTNVLVMPQIPCNVGTPFNVGFDDESPLAQSNMACPPTGGTAYKSKDPLSTFVGEDAAGDWKLSVKIVGNLPSGGAINSWTLEVCGASSPIDPVVTNNNTACTKPGEAGTIISDYLLVDDADNSPSELSIYIVQVPTEGFISRGGTQLGVGGSFTMQDVYSSQVKYNNTNASATTDQFTFYIEDVTGGFNGLHTMYIDITDGCATDARERLLDNQTLVVFPNPASDVLNVELLNGNGNMEAVSVFNAQGQMVLSRQLDTRTAKSQINVGHLPTGVYLVQVRTEAGVVAKKVMID